MWAWIAGAALLMPAQGETDAAWRAYDEGRYFELVRSNEKLPLFLEGFVDAGLNRLALAEKKLTLASKQLSGKRKEEALGHLATVQARLGEYGAAADSCGRALTELGARLTAEKRKDIQTSRTLWGALKSVPSMRVVKSGDTMLLGPKVAGFKMPFRSGGRSFTLSADTGADLSLVREGLGKEMGLRMIRTPIKVGSISGESVNAWLGVAKELSFGNARVGNAVFLVMRDKDLYFPHAKFQLDGVIGLPVLMALGEVTFWRDGRVEIPREPRTSGAPNLFVSGLKPFIEGEFGGERLTFAFDSGANATMLYPPFIRKFKAEVDAKGFPQNHRVFGVAGPKDTQGFMLMDFRMKVGGQEILWPTMEIIAEKRDRNSDRFYGNLGLDMLAGFESTTFNWKAMRLALGRRLGK